MSQNEQIIKRLKKGWCSPLDALRDCGSMKLATRVGELKKDGHKIIDKWVEQGGKRFKCYRVIR